MKRLVVLVTVLLWCSCGGGGDNVVKDTAGLDVAADSVADVAAEPDQGGGPDRRGEADVGVDFGPGDPDLAADTGTGCEPGEGCFLDPCEEHEECLSNWCVQHLGDKVCTITCQAECPPGWSCNQVAGTAPDLVFVCVSEHANLCKPCATGADCKGVGGAEDVCVDYGDEGSFCGGACAADDDCPWGFACAEAVTVNGVGTWQCVAEAGVCPCTDTSVSLGLATPCAVGNEFGTCTGQRVCTEDGLSDCDAAVPSEETCDGVDNDCDGDVDEPAEVAGDYVNLCFDDNACTTDECLGEEGCNHTSLSEGECVDGDACTVGDHCEEGACVGLPIACDDGNPCTDDLCDGLGGCKAEFNTDSCDDGDPCTVADTCKEGACVGYGVDCECQEDGDCAALEDGDLCNGTLVCNQEKLPYQCAVDPETVVVCPQPVDGTDICQQVECLPESGECVTSPAFEGFACDDGDACTVGDKCQEGSCVGGVPMACNDGNVCTNDGCDAVAGCLFENNSDACTDNDVCTVGDGCVDGLCVPGAGALDCDDDNPCTEDGCDPVAGCVHAAVEGVCDDGNDCTAGDHCAEGTCTFEGLVDCDDDNPCTADGCTPAGGCTHTIVAGPCDDGDPCTVNDSCVNGQCTAGATLNCDDGNPCTADSCGDAGLCLHEGVDGACDDGNACTIDDHCAAGQCVASQSPDCDDDNVCTTDSCHPDSGCVHLLNSVPCDDEDVCTTGDHCHLGECISSGSLECNDNNPCTDDSCKPESGCFFAPNGAACDDGNTCTVDDHCANGVCAAGPVLECDDGNPCTDDYCDYEQGCIHVNNDDPCNDANACTANEFCSKGVCGGGVAIVCEDENMCTDDSCQPEVGCVYTPNSVACDDGDACTDGDGCADGACVSGGPLDCDDGNVCTEDSCDSESGCVHTPVADESPCGEELHCMAGECVPICVYVPGSQTFDVTMTIVNFTVPECVESLTIEAWGAQGGKNNPCTQQGGKGARMKGTFTVTPGEILKVVVGQRGKDRGSNTANESGTGGGGSFVWRAANEELLVAAGGGGGGAICTSGGSPTYATGKDGVTGNCGTKDSYNVNPGGCDGANGTGGECYGKGWDAVLVNPVGVGSGSAQGGYGGGGTVGASHGGGGGGGYGGGGCRPYVGHPASAGGGGGSYNGGTDKEGVDGVQANDGQIVMTW